MERQAMRHKGWDQEVDAAHRGLLEMILVPYRQKLANPELDIESAREILFILPDEVIKHPAWPLWLLEDPSMADSYRAAKSPKPNFEWLKKRNTPSNGQVYWLPPDAKITWPELETPMEAPASEPGSDHADALAAALFSLSQTKAPIK